MAVQEEEMETAKMSVQEEETEAAKNREFSRQLPDSSMFDESTIRAVTVVSVVGKELIKILGSAGDTRFKTYCDFDIDQFVKTKRPRSAADFQILAESLVNVVQEIICYKDTELGLPAILAEVKIGKKKWNVDEMLAKEKEGITLEQALFTAFEQKQRIKLDAYVPIHGIPMEVTTVFKIQITGSIMESDKEEQRQHALQLKKEICDLIKGKKRMKAAKRLITLRNVVDPDKALRSKEINKLYALFATSIAELTQIAAFFQTLLDLKDHHDSEATVLMAKPKELIERVVQLLRKLHLSTEGLGLSEILQLARQILDDAGKRSIPPQMWTDLHNLRLQILEKVDQLTEEWLADPDRKIDLEELASFFVEHAM
eukprot:TRINITY_DN15237_c0_g1_i7.p1 TRINITY_DN15237_c0_g1~~TRINITY_DN15237_c0_g1_i7.p1  ORF type:complete len:371 (-),score=106.01 TRINITY_DN15237_c0_g1_i7:256-1368(-)